MSIDAVSNRWDGFLAQIEGRFDAIMRESIEGCLALFEQTQETLTLSNAWTGMRLRALNLRTKVQDTWDEKVSSAFEDAGVDGAREDAERRKGEDLHERMEHEAERVEIHIYCEIARRLEARAVKEQGAWSCSQCGAPMQRRFVFRATNQGCGACSALNTLEPGTNARMVEGMSHYLCREAAWGEWLQMQTADRRWRDERNTTLEILQAREATQIAYWTKFLRHRISLFPERAANFDVDLRGKMHQFYVSIQNDRAWIAAGRPRRVAPPIGAS